MIEIKSRLGLDDGSGVCIRMCRRSRGFKRARVTGSKVGDEAVVGASVAPSLYSVNGSRELTILQFLTWPNVTMAFQRCGNTGGRRSIDNSRTLLAQRIALTFALRRRYDVQRAGTVN